jgi:hypothetical protein
LLHVNFERLNNNNLHLLLVIIITSSGPGEKTPSCRNSPPNTMPATPRIKEKGVKKERERNPKKTGTLLVYQCYMLLILVSSYACHSMTMKHLDSVLKSSLQCIRCTMTWIPCIRLYRVTLA